MNRKPFTGPRGFHKKKRVAKKLFRRWQASHLEEIEKLWGSAGIVEKRADTCECCDSRTPAGTMFWSERTDYYEMEHNSYCAACAFDHHHQYDNFDHCTDEDCLQMLDNPVRKKTGKLKYVRCPECGSKTMTSSKMDILPAEEEAFTGVTEQLEASCSFEILDNEISCLEEGKFKLDTTIRRFKILNGPLEGATVRVKEAKETFHDRTAYVIRMTVIKKDGLPRTWCKKSNEGSVVFDDFQDNLLEVTNRIIKGTFPDTNFWITQDVAA